MLRGEPDRVCRGARDGCSAIAVSSNTIALRAYQKTGVYHVLVLAGLHVAALAALFVLDRAALALLDGVERRCSRLPASAHSPRWWKTASDPARYG